MLRTITALLFLGTLLVPLYGYCTNLDTNLKLVPKRVPMVPKVPKSGTEYMSIKCGYSPEFMKTLKPAYGMEPLWWGMNKYQNVITLHRNHNTGNWGLFVSFPSREVCAISTGMEQDLILPNIGMAH